MNFDYYKPFFSQKLSKWCPGVTCQKMDEATFFGLLKNGQVVEFCRRIEKGEKDLKTKLPAVCWMGISNTGKRQASNMRPTGIIMLDIDHVEDPVGVFKSNIESHLIENKIYLVHITPSGKGLRILFENRNDCKTVEENMMKMHEILHLEKAGDFDTAVKDLSRLSFVVDEGNVLFYDVKLFDEHPVYIETMLPISSPKDKQGSLPSIDKDEEIEILSSLYRGTPVTAIIKKYVEVRGEPSDGERHNFYNEMVKNFRCILDNNKRKLFVLLPKFGHSDDECWSQIQSICRVNTLSRLPSDFYYFLKDNGYYVDRYLSKKAAETIGLLSDKEIEPLSLPPLPPVFREILAACPPDFIMPAVQALLPIMGTLTSYLRAVYPYDSRVHSTSFFSVIYAPPGTGKGFVERYIDLLFSELQKRDLVTSMRENIYLRAVRSKSANDKSPQEPHVSTRIIPPKNSEAEFLMKQQDNKGYHMFTYAAEMDSWAKGVRAAGGNKDDMVRIAWDNGEYGQQFRSANTFKGLVRLYWNVLITGTLNQLENYFKNVENGLVTRCSFASIDNQQFAEAPKWGKITKKGMQIIDRFKQRCDENTYMKPCTVDMDILSCIQDEDFDKEIDWKFEFRPFKNVDMSWIMPTIDCFLKAQLKEAAVTLDNARDVFRRRVAVRGFRLALMCTALYEKPEREAARSVIKEFVLWYMENDIKGIMELFGSKYNELADKEHKTNVPRQCVFDSLPDKFTNNDVFVCCQKNGILSNVSEVVYRWRKLGLVDKIASKTYKKLKK